MTDIKHAHERIDQMEHKLNSHGEQIKALSMSIKETSESLHENTRLTQEVANNTAELVDLFKGAKTFRKLILGVAPVIAALYALYLWIKTQ